MTAEEASQDGRVRCFGGPDDPMMMKYHDEEWGVPVHDDRKLFESLALDGFQAGLSWRTILNKRDAFRSAFDEFDPELVAGYGQVDVERLLADAGIVRNRLKIAATISNARLFLEVQRDIGSFDSYIWRFTGHQTLRNHGDDAGLDHAVRRDVRRSAEARVQVRRHNHLLRVHAGGRHGQRPRRRVLEAGGVARSRRWSLGRGCGEAAGGGL